MAVALGCHFQIIPFLDSSIFNQGQSLPGFPLCQLLTFFSYEVRRLKLDLVLYYKCFHNLVSLSSAEYFNLSQHVTQTRTGGNRLIIPICNTNNFRNDFCNRCLSIWNTLPLHIVNASSVLSFKRLLSSFDLRPFLYCTYF